MGCYTFKNRMSQGFICGDFGPHCTFCGNISDLLCDFLVGYVKTCDRPLCEGHGFKIDDDLHYCPIHYKIFLSTEIAKKATKILPNGIDFKSLNPE